MSTHRVELSKDLHLSDIERIMSGEATLHFDEDSRARVESAKRFLEEKVLKEKATIYGVNTGFGSFCEVRIDGHDLEQLQENLLLSHACGLGDDLPVEIVRIMLASKASALCRGHSGVSLQLVEKLISLYNNDLIPSVPEQGSLGASGDLAPLAHMSLPLIGKGHVIFNKERIPFEKLSQKQKPPKHKLEVKEGLALLNGTQFMSASLSWSLIQAYELLKSADLIGAMSAFGWNARIDAYDPHTHWLRRHQGQRISAQRIYKLLDDAEVRKIGNKLVQDPYSFRCMPQVHGASLDSMEYVKGIVVDELNSVTDNPIIFPDDELVISGGNFHGQYLAIAADLLKIALAELCSISERRIFKLLSAQRGLPAFLTEPDKAGLNSGMMIPQYTAASIVSQNKQLASPASVDSLSSSNGQEDHVSMGANACNALRKIVSNTYKVLGIELLSACQAIDFRLQDEGTEGIRDNSTLLSVYGDFRKISEHISSDRILSTDMESAIVFLKDQKFLSSLKDL